MERVIEAATVTWRTLKRVYHTAAFLCLAFVAVTVTTGHASGYGQLTMPIGTTINQVDATQLSAPAATPAKQKAEKHADAAPLPVENPPVPYPGSGQEMQGAIVIQQVGNFYLRIDDLTRVLAQPDITVAFTTNQVESIHASMAHELELRRQSPSRGRDANGC